MTDNPNAFKHWFDRKLVRRLGADLQRVWPEFDAKAFAREAAGELDALELKPRVRAIAAALRNHLPDDYPTAVDVIVRALGPELGPAEDGFAGSAAYWPYGQFIETYGLDHPDASLRAMVELTRRATAEFAIRPFLARHPDLTLKYLRRWAKDPNEHVRRLVSEGTRPRLPWGMRLRLFVDDPAPVLALLETLKDDPSLYVRRSVANHLNDLLKDNPWAAMALLRRWLRDADANTNRRWIVERALRHQAKAGDAEALALLGYAATAVVAEKFSVRPARIALGDSLDLVAELRNPSRRRVALMVDYAIRFVRKDGGHGRKVFKWKTLELAPGARATLTRQAPVKPVTTRRHYAGRHPVELQVNGKVVARRHFDLVV